MKTACPACGEQKLVRVIYGYPMEDDFERARAGDIALGGCIVRPDAPTHVCLKCGAKFGRLEEDPESLGGAAFVTPPSEP